MAYTLPDGSKLFLSTTTGPAVAISGITNDNPAAATANGHTLTANAVGILTTGWEDANERVFRVGSPEANTFTLMGLDATSTNLYTPGSGAGSFLPITGWQEIQQVLNPSTSGGEQQYTTVEPLARKNAIQLPTSISPMTITIPIGDDPSLPGYIALKAASDNRELRALRIQKPNGATNYFYGYVSLNEVPSLTKGQVDTVTASFALQGMPTRYTTAV